MSSSAKVRVAVVNRSTHSLPSYASVSAAGLDLRAYLPSESIVLHPMGRALVPTGLYIELPPGYEAQIRPRSGLALREGLTLLNTPGTIDADYRGEIKVLMVNLSDKAVEVRDGMRVAQLILARYEQVEWSEVEQLSPTERGEGGFGSTGMS